MKILGIACLCLLFMMVSAAGEESLPAEESLYWCYFREYTMDGSGMRAPAVMSLDFHDMEVKAQFMNAYLIESDVEEGVVMVAQDTENPARWDLLYYDNAAIEILSENVMGSDWVRILAYKNERLYYVRRTEREGIYAYGQMGRDMRCVEYPDLAARAYFTEDLTDTTYTSSYDISVSDDGTLAYCVVDDDQNSTIHCATLEKADNALVRGTSPVWLDCKTLLFVDGDTLYCYDMDADGARPFLTETGEQIVVDLKVRDTGMTLSRQGDWLSYIQHSSKSEQVVVVSLRSGMHFVIDEIQAVPLLRDRSWVVWG